MSTTLSNICEKIIFLKFASHLNYWNLLSFRWTHTAIVFQYKIVVIIILLFKAIAEDLAFIIA